MWSRPVVVVNSGAFGSDHGGAHDEDPEQSAASSNDQGTSVNGVVYLVIENDGGQDDRLLGASSSIADAVEPHESTVDEAGIMRMRPLEAADILAGEQVRFEPGGRHLMLIGLHRTLSAGETFEVTLDFQRSGSITVEVEVRASYGSTP